MLKKYVLLWGISFIVLHYFNFCVDISLFMCACPIVLKKMNFLESSKYVVYNFTSFLVSSIMLYTELTVNKYLLNEG